MVSVDSASREAAIERVREQAPAD